MPGSDRWSRIFCGTRYPRVSETKIKVSWSAWSAMSSKILPPSPEVLTGVLSTLNYPQNRYSPSTDYCRVPVVLLRPVRFYTWSTQSDGIQYPPEYLEYRTSLVLSISMFLWFPVLRSVEGTPLLNKHRFLNTVRTSELCTLNSICAAGI